MTIINRKCKAKTVKAADVKDVIQIHNLNGETVVLVKLDASHAEWVKIEK